jgi:hypothetical protein
MARLSFPSRVRIDNDVSPTATIEVQAGDRLEIGLPYGPHLASLISTSFEVGDGEGACIRRVLRA